MLYFLYFLVIIICISLILRTVNSLQIRNINSSNHRYIERNKYNKYNKRNLSTEVTFSEDNYNTFCIIQYKLKNMNIDELKKKLDKWAYINFKLPLNVKIIHEESNKYINNLYKTTKPSHVIINTTHLILFFPKEDVVIALLDHYYIDGFIFFSYYQYLLDIKYEFKLPKYKYIPLVSDILVIQYFAKLIPKLIFIRSQFLTDDKSQLMTKTVYKNDYDKWDRWTLYSIVFYEVFKYCETIEKFTLALTVGINTDQNKGNNRIGAIIINLIKPNNFNNNSYSDNCKNIELQLKKKISKNYKDSIISYDILRSYPISSMRSNIFDNYLDIIFTSTPKLEKKPMIVNGFGGFMGREITNKKLYISANTFDDMSIISYSVTTKNWDTQKFLEQKNTKLWYTF
jgi:hypothetical protein